MIPLSARITLLETLVSLTTFLLTIRKIARRNLERAFPDKDIEWRNTIVEECQRAHARLIVDFMRLDVLTLLELEKKIEFPMRDRLLALVKKKNRGAQLYLQQAIWVALNFWCIT